MSVQLKRTDLVRIAAERLREQIADEIRAAGAAEVRTRESFRVAMLGVVSTVWNGVLSDACRMVGTDQDRLTIDVHLEMTDDVVANPPESVSVTVRDDVQWAARLLMRLQVRADQAALGAWVAAAKRKAAAEARGTSAKDLDAEARAKMIDDLLAETPEGRGVLEAMARFVAASRL